MVEPDYYIVLYKSIESKSLQFNYSLIDLLPRVYIYVFRYKTQVFRYKTQDNSRIKITAL